jgi:hypothetical protein
MRVAYVILREILYRKLNFLLGVVAVASAAGCLVAELTLLRAHDRRTEELIAAKEDATKERMRTLEDDYRTITLKMGFNLLILPAGQNLGDLYADDYGSKCMPEEYAERLAQSRVATINHVLPSLEQKVKWPEHERTIILSGVRGEVYIQSRSQSPLLETVPAGTMVVGYELHRSLKLEAGQKVKLLGREFSVARLHKERGNKDDITVWINLAEAQQLLGKQGQINAIRALECGCEPGRIAAIRAEVQNILPDTQVIEFAGQTVARAEARNRAQQEAQAAVQAEKAARAELRSQREAFAAIIVPLVLLGAGLWVGLLALHNVRERRVEVGIWRALGLRSSQIIAIFLGKAALTGLAGAGAGYIAGLLIALRWEGTALAFGEAFDAAQFGMVLLAAPLVAGVASWLPALAAAQQDPAVVLGEG